MDNQSSAVLGIIVLFVLYLVYVNNFSRTKARTERSASRPFAVGRPNLPMNLPNTDSSEPQIDHSEYVKQSSLESAVFDSHNKFIDEVHHRTTGASLMTTRGDDNDVNP